MNKELKAKKRGIVFSKMFANIILRNKIVATVLYMISEQIKVMNRKIDLQTNLDI